MSWSNAVLAALVAYLSSTSSSSSSILVVSPRMERFLAVLSVLTILRKLLKLNRKQVVNSVLSLFRTITPKAMMEAALSKATKGEMENIEKKILGDGDPDANTCIPKVGFSKREIFEKAIVQRKRHEGFESGQKWGGIYHDDRNLPDLPEIQSHMWSQFHATNLLYPAVFPGARKFEAEVVSMVLDMVQGNCGLLSSGGTESILIAVLAYREQARKERGIENPEIVACVTAHPALSKACRYFGVGLVKVPNDPVTFQMSLKHTKAAISSNTIAIYASAPTFTHGVIDDVESLSKLAKSRNVGLHVDNCLGGFLTSYMMKEGLLKSKKFDFRVPGVTTMSVDVHKYGFASKGVSVVAFRDPSLRRHSYMPSSDGCEGLYVTTTLQGSRAGGVVAQAWATLMHIGDKGYRNFARQMHGVMQRVEKIVKSLEPNLRILVSSDACCVPITSDTIDIYKVAGMLEKRGWNMFTGQNPPVMTICVGEQHLHVLDRWAQDLKDSVQDVVSNPHMKIEGNAAVYGAAKNVPDDVLDGIMRSYCDTLMRVKEKKK